ncbi:hypothetical protein LES9216_00695 [Leuconostoc suionicum]|uniref:Uncharacterized protein n=1 Tax=Leuconostoc suionicum TaxID=1511761 RepID=A0A2N9K882_9LACO|nr:hypothetical protein LES8486_00548 [Leuconostoc suionicum]SPE06792.1 hypothetical protein LES9216_00695 [Leuconostoc suionicum]SPH03299.1 hypothetical protein LES8484_00548 [Leuconostoc suionicum]
MNRVLLVEPSFYGVESVKSAKKHIKRINSKNILAMLLAL